MLSKMKSLKPLYLWGKKLENNHKDLGNIAFPVDRYSIIVWIKSTGLLDGTVRTALSLYGNPQNFIYYRKLSSDNLIRIQHQMDGFNSIFDYTCMDTNWFMTTLTIIDNVASFYVNGKQVGGNEEANPAINELKGVVGAINNKGDSPWRGGVGYIGIYKPLQESDLITLYKNSGL